MPLRSKRIEVGIVGAGRVGRTLGRSLRENGFRIGPVINRSLRSARAAVRFIGAGTPANALTGKLATSEIILIGVPDPKIEALAHELASLGGISWPRKTVLHLSGSRNAHELSPVGRLGAHCGSFHPLLPMPWPLERLPRPVFFAVEGDREASRLGIRMARALGGTPILLESRNKTLYHAAATLAGGHLMALAEISVRMFVEAGVPTDKARAAISSAVHNTVRQYESLAGNAWTGPIARRDLETVSKHQRELQRLPHCFREIYDLLGRISVDLFRPHPGRNQHKLLRLLQGKIASLSGN